MNITATERTDPATLVNRPARFGHMLGRFTDLRHLTINPATGRSRMGLEPGLIGSFDEQPSALCNGGNTSTYVKYGDTIELLED